MLQKAWYSDTLDNFKYFLGYIVCFSNVPLNLIRFTVTLVICIFVTHVPVSIYALVDEIKIYLFIYYDCV